MTITDVDVPTEDETASPLPASVRPRQLRREEKEHQPLCQLRGAFPPRPFQSPAPLEALQVKGRAAGQKLQVPARGGGGCRNPLWCSVRSTLLWASRGKSPHRPLLRSKGEEKLQRRLGGSPRATKRPRLSWGRKGRGARAGGAGYPHAPRAHKEPTKEESPNNTRSKAGPSNNYGERCLSFSTRK